MTNDNRQKKEPIYGISKGVKERPLQGLNRCEDMFLGRVTFVCGGGIGKDYIRYWKKTIEKGHFKD